VHTGLCVVARRTHILPQRGGIGSREQRGREHESITVLGISEHKVGRAHPAISMTMLDQARRDLLPWGVLIGMPTASAIQKPDTLSI
jgi:hypothetical protein